MLIEAFVWEEAANPAKIRDGTVKEEKHKLEAFLLPDLLHRRRFLLGRSLLLLDKGRCCRHCVTYQEIE